MPIPRSVLIAALAAGRVGLALAGDVSFLGPSAYTSQANSPFDLSPGGGIVLEDFEDNTLSTPGVTPSTGSPTGPGGYTDSVDGDDGAIDGSGTNGHSFFASPGSTGITFTFDAGVLGGFPTAAGMVWTDGDGPVTFEAFDAVGGSLGTIGPVAIADGSIIGETAEDRFFGVVHAGGISAIKLSNTSGGIEVDHLQYSAGPVTVTTTTTASTATTTTTLAGAACATVPIGPTFASLNCRLAALAARIAASTEITKQQTQLVDQLGKAKERKNQAETSCAQSDAKHAGKRLKQAVRKMIQFGHRLRSNTGRRSMPAALRTELITTGDGIKADLQTRRKALACPADAAG
ncbi:MAG TPA: hypothetical protein VKA21_01100 [Candidatus Binatia bacterium]|nr:hypothetical protein [Candidatus Binatia bacterium]